MLEAIKKGVSVATKNLHLVLIVYIVSLIFGLISMPFMRQIGMEATPGITPTLPIGFWIVIIISFLVQIFVMGGVLGGAREAIKKGKAALSQFISAGKTYYLKLLLSGLLGFVIALAYGLLFAALVGGIAVAGIAVKIILGLLLAVYIIFGVVLALMLVFWPYAIVSENIGVIAGLKKGIEISKTPAGNLLKILGIVVILLIAAFLVNLIISLPQALFNQAVVALQLYRIIVVGAVGAFLNVAIISALMSYYFILKGGKGSSASEV